MDLVREQADDPDWNEGESLFNVRAALQQRGFILTIVVTEINEELSLIIHYVNSAGDPTF